MRKIILVLLALATVLPAAAQNYCPDTTIVTASPATGEELYVSPLGADDWDQNARNLSAICRGEATPGAATLPATCSPPALFFDTDAAAGLNLYGCTAVDVWTLLGDGGAALTVREEDGAPSVANVLELRVADGTLTDNGGGSVSLTTGGGGGGAASEITNDSGVTGATVADALDTLDGGIAGKAATDHSATHHQAGSDELAVEALASACGAGAPIEGDGAGGAQCGTDNAGTDDQTATEVAIADSGAFYTGTDVEAALQEVGPTMTNARAPTAHAASHAENAGDELLVENQGTACADGLIFKADATGGVVCGSAGSAAFTTLDSDYGDEVYTSTFDAGGAIVELPNSTAPVGTDCDDAAESGRVHVDTDAPSGEQLYVCEGATGWTLQGGGGGTGVAYYRDERASGTVGGDTVPAVWNTRTLNTESADTIGATLAANAVTLPAGTYRIRAQAPAIQVGFHRLRLFDVTNTVTLAVGPASFSNGTSGGDQYAATIWTRLTLAAPTAIRLDHWTQADTRTTDDLGSPISTGDVEVYAELWVEEE